MCNSVHPGQFRALSLILLRSRLVYIKVYRGLPGTDFLIDIPLRSFSKILQALLMPWNTLLSGCSVEIGLLVLFHDARRAHPLLQDLRRSSVLHKSSVIGVVCMSD